MLIVGTSRSCMTFKDGAVFAETLAEVTPGDSHSLDGIVLDVLKIGNEGLTLPYILLARILECTVDLAVKGVGIVHGMRIDESDKRKQRANSEKDP